MLSDPELTKEKNLLLDLDEPWKPIHQQNEELGDHHTGKLYKNGWEQFCNESERDVLCAFLFFLDKTHTDVQGKLPVEPASFTLSVLNRDTRNKPFGWKNA